MNKYRKEKYILQRKGRNGSWSFQVFIRKDGFSITETFNESDYGTPKLAFDTAVRYRDRKLDEISRKIYVPDQSISLREVFEESEELANLNAKTKRNHVTLYNRFIRDLDLKDFNSEFMIRSLNAMTFNSSNDTISRVFKLFKQIDDTALLKGYYAIPRCIGFKAPKSKQIIDVKDDRVTNVETLREVIKQCNDDTIIGILYVAYYTGMRPGEIFALGEGDIIGDWIRVNKQIGSDSENEGVIRNTKTSDSTRMIPISPFLAPVLARFKGPVLFKTPSGDYYNSNRFNARTSALFRPYNLSLYKCRHLFATTLEYSAVDRRTIDALMGHSVQNSTDIYVHTDRDKMVRAIGLIEKL